jgi:hypothetical protein
MWWLRLTKETLKMQWFEISLMSSHKENSQEHHLAVSLCGNDTHVRRYVNGRNKEVI